MRPTSSRQVETPAKSRESTPMLDGKREMLQKVESQPRRGGVQNKRPVPASEAYPPWKFSLARLAARPRSGAVLALIQPLPTLV
jgi:hypothetical protein